jgi:hypothetical protein
LATTNFIARHVKYLFLSLRALLITPPSLIHNHASGTQSNERYMLTDLRIGSEHVGETPIAMLLFNGPQWQRAMATGNGKRCFVYPPVPYTL